MSDQNASRLERARILVEQKRFEQAEVQLRQLLAGDTERATALSYLALALLGQNRLDEADQAAAQSIGEDPERSYGYYVRAIILRNKRDYPAAEESARVALGKNHQYAPYRAQLGWVLLIRGKVQEALDLTEFGLKAEPQNVDLLQVRAEGLLAFSRLDGARETGQVALAQDPEDATTLSQLGRIELRSGNAERAFSMFAGALRIDPTNVLARRGIVTSLKARNIVYRICLRRGNPGPWPRFQWSLAYLTAMLIRLSGYAVITLLLIALPVLVLYGMCVIDPVMVLWLRRKPEYRLILPKEEVRRSDWVGALLGPALVFLAIALVTKTNWPILATLVFASLALPASTPFAGSLTPRRSGIVAAILGAIGAIGLISLATGGNQGVYGPAFVTCIMGSMIAGLMHLKGLMPHY